MATITVEDAKLLPGDFAIFFCWQDHLEPKHYRFFIRDALNRAIGKVQASLPKEAAHCVLRQDSDTMNRAGSVEIANTICQKIRASTMVVGDVTPVLKDGDRFYPNPNVMLEVGYAGGAIGWNRVVCLYDSEICRPEELPFDIRHRRANSFSSIAKVEATKAMSDLEGTLFVAIRAVVQEIGRGDYDPTLGDADKRRHRDLVLLKDTLSTISPEFIEYYVERGLGTALVYDILFYWHGFEAIVSSTSFRFYDKELEARSRALLLHWGTAIDLGGYLYSPNGVGGYSLKAEQYWDENYEKMLEQQMSELEETKRSLKSLLDHVHDHYAEIDLKETSRAAYESIKKYIENER